MEISLIRNEVRKVQIELLDELDRICKKHNITYHLFAGTLLGAVRHRGFIPWDDDLDVSLLREDYEKLIKVINTELDDKYYFESPEKDKHSPFPFAKLKKNNTYFKEASLNKKMHHGIFIDIFQLDDVPSDKKKLEKLRKRLNFWYFLKSIKVLNYEKSRSFKNTIIKYFIVTIIKPFLLPFSFKYINGKINKLATTFNHLDYKMVGHLTCHKIRKEIFHAYLYDKENFKETIYLDFEGKKYLAPKGYDKVLTDLYGDYMTPPKEQERHPYHASRVSFDNKKYYDITLKYDIKGE